MTEVYVVGVGMTKFGNHGPGVGVPLAVEAATAALRDAGTDYAAIDAVYSGAAHPLSPQSITVARELGLTGPPVQHISNASATGLAVAHEAIVAIQAGRADVVLGLAYDSPKTYLPVEDLITGEGFAPPAVSFALWARERMERYGTRPEHLAMVAAKNWNYARSNPFAARQAPAEVTTERVLASKMVADPFTSMMCTPWGEGAGAAVFCSEAALERFDASRAVRVAASAFQTDVFGPHHVLEGAIVGPPALTRNTAQRALDDAGRKVEDVDIVQVHDAFAVEEILYYEQLGFAEQGEGEKLLETGAFGPGSRQRTGLPEFSTDGGLIARGHPGGATGMAQIWETVRRLREPTDDRVGLCHLLGASSVCVVQVYERIS